MLVYTDNTEFADRIVPAANWSRTAASTARSEIRALLESMYEGRDLHECFAPGPRRWQYVLLSGETAGSQYDLLIDLRRQGVELPDGVLCLSGEGKGLHGLKARPWAAVKGNIHLSVHLMPGRLEDESGIGFMVLAAVSVVDAIDSIPGISVAAGIKWVNDILLGDAKVGGVLAYTQGTGSAVDAAVLGIGLNVETTPIVDSTPFVPRVSSLRDYATSVDKCTRQIALEKLLIALDRNYDLLLEGGSGELLDRYRNRSLVVGRNVTVCVDEAEGEPKTMARGRVCSLGDNLELVLEGQDRPISRGRLILDKKA